MYCEAICVLESIWLQVLSVEKRWTRTLKYYYIQQTEEREREKHRRIQVGGMNTANIIKAGMNNFARLAY